MFEIIASLGVLAALPLSVAMGAALVAHGYPKLNRKAIERMKGLGLPPAATAVGALTEFVGRIALIIGFLTPLAALLIAGDARHDAPFEVRDEQGLSTRLRARRILPRWGFEAVPAGRGPLSIDAVLRR